mmetsp:Transcript_34709/g.46019  ORF Transcript_34709/g.46019 Transcript_34709/m.46019 type:complete len:129 (+) Transcript_34709:236-622(+)
MAHSLGFNGFRINAEEKENFGQSHQSKLSEEVVILSYISTIEIDQRETNRNDNLFWNILFFSNTQMYLYDRYRKPSSKSSSVFIKVSGWTSLDSMVWQIDTRPLDPPLAHLDLGNFSFRFEERQSASI